MESRMVLTRYFGKPLPHNINLQRWIQIGVVEANKNSHEPQHHQFVEQLSLDIAVFNLQTKLKRNFDHGPKS